MAEMILVRLVLIFAGALVLLLSFGVAGLLWLAARLYLEEHRGLPWWLRLAVWAGWFCAAGLMVSLGAFVAAASIQ